jgi:ribosomal protein L11 methyltransferase
LKVFLNDCHSELVSESYIKQILKTQRNILKARGFSDLELGTWNYTIEEKENQDWSQKWKEKWDVTHVTDKITVVPDWIEYTPKESEVIIKMEPGCAFGTGTHETTQLCMRAIQNHLNNGDRVADIGMGSGILSVLAKKFGASYVYGCDNDDTVIDVAKENALKNGVECVFELGTADKVNDKFDFVCANILHNVLAEIMPDLKNLLKEDGLLSLSGILEEKAPVVVNAINKCGLKIVEQDRINQWVGFLVRR